MGKKTFSSSDYLYLTVTLCLRRYRGGKGVPQQSASHRSRPPSGFLITANLAGVRQKKYFCTFQGGESVRCDLQAEKLNSRSGELQFEG
jgi:hypothetical protein